MKIRQNIQNALVKTGFADLGIQERPGLVVLNRTKMPAVLIESGFIDNVKDNQFYDQNLEKIARAIADGILATFQELERPTYYQIQTGAYRDRGLADQMEEQLYEQGFPVFMVDEDGWYKLRVGSFLGMDNAVHMEQRLRQKGYPTVMIKV